jgi:hypothetical protein
MLCQSCYAPSSAQSIRAETKVSVSSMAIRLQTPLLPSGGPHGLQLPNGHNTSGGVLDERVGSNATFFPRACVEGPGVAHPVRALHQRIQDETGRCHEMRWGLARLSSRGCLNGSAFWAPEWRSLADWSARSRGVRLCFGEPHLSAAIVPSNKGDQLQCPQSGISGERSFVNYETSRESPPDFTAMFKVALLGRLSL